MLPTMPPWFQVLGSDAAGDAASDAASDTTAQPSSGCVCVCRSDTALTHGQSCSRHRIIPSDPRQKADLVLIRCALPVRCPCSPAQAPTPVKAAKGDALGKKKSFCSVQVRVGL